MADDDYNDGEEEFDEAEPKYTVLFQGEEKKANFLIKDGVASAEFANGDTYEGEYKDGKRNGKGKYTFQTGGLKATYSGDYVDGRKEGEGTLSVEGRGKYSGQWRGNQRHGAGSYYYDNGDKFIGNWRKGTKHGRGTYVFAGNRGQLVGEWSNNKCMHGVWEMHTGTKFFGSFLNNQPDGPGVFQFVDGRTESGHYETQKVKDPEDDQLDIPTLVWVRDKEQRLAIGTKPRVPVAVSQFEQAKRDLEKCVLRLDHAQGLTRLRQEAEGVPNFRRANPPQHGEASAVFGSAQPTARGLPGVLDILQEHGFGRVRWFNLRQDAVVYIDDIPYSARDAKQQISALEFPSLSAAQLAELDTQLSQLTARRITRAGGLLSYYTAPHTDHPLDSKASAQMIEVQAPQELEDPPQADEPQAGYNVRFPIDVFESALGKDEEAGVALRFPMRAEGAPSLETFDALVNMLKEADPNSAVCFSCRTGEDATTTGMVMATLLKRVTGEPVPEPQPADYDENAPDFKNAQFRVVMSMVEALGKDGEVIKAEADLAIDQCAHLLNLRTSILQLKQKFERAEADRREHYRQLALRAVERYFFMILFNAYLRDATKPPEKPPKPEKKRAPRRRRAARRTREDGDEDDMGMDDEDGDRDPDEEKGDGDDEGELEEEEEEEEEPEEEEPEEEEEFVPFSISFSKWIEGRPQLTAFLQGLKDFNWT